MELRIVLDILWRRRWSLIKIFAATFLTVVGLTLLAVPTYDTTARVLLRSSTALGSLMDAIGIASTQSSSISDTDRADGLELVLSRPVVEGMINQIDLKRERTRSRIMRAFPPLKALFWLLGMDLSPAGTHVKMGYDELLQPSLTAAVFSTPTLEAAQVEESDLIEIEAAAPEPEVAQNMANTMAELFVATELERLQQDFATSRAYIDANIKGANQRYQVALKELEAFRDKEGIVSIEEEVERLTERSTELKKNYESLDMTIKATQTSMDAVQAELKKVPKFDKSSEQFVASDTLRSLRSTLQELYLELATTKDRYTADHPNVISINSKIAEAKAQITQQAEKEFSGETISKDSVYTDLSSKLVAYAIELVGYEVQREILPPAIADYDKRILELTKRSKYYEQLQLAISTSQAIYTAFYKYKYQLEMIGTALAPRVVILERAPLPERSDSRHRSPSLFLNTVIAIFLGGVFGVGGVLIMQYIEDRVETTAELRELAPAVSYLGALPRLRRLGPELLDPVRVVRRWRKILSWVHAPLSPLTTRIGMQKSMERWSAELPEEPLVLDLNQPLPHLREALRGVCSALRLALPRMEAITVASCTQGDGKGFVTVNLGITLAAEGRKVLLLDGNLYAPGLHSWFEPEESPAVSAGSGLVCGSGSNSVKREEPPGIHEVLDGSASLEAALRPTPVPGLSLLAAGAPFVDPAAVVDSPEWARLLTMVRERFEVVLIAAPALERSTAALRLGELSQGVVLVVGSGVTKRRHLPEVLELAAAHRVALLGVVLNKTPDAQGLLS